MSGTGYEHLSTEKDNVVLIGTGVAAGISFLTTSFTLFLYCKFDCLRTFAFKLVTFLNFTGFLLSISSIIFVVLDLMDEDQSDYNWFC